MDNLKIWLIIAQLINFSVLFFAFKFFLWDKIVKAINDRRIKLEKMEQIDSEMSKKLEESKEQSEKVLQDARKKSDDMILEAESIAKNKKSSILEEAESEAKHILQSWLADIEKEKLSMISDVKENIVDLVLRFNKKLFWKENISSDFVKKEIELMK